jgi:hypothetical protein
MRLVFFMRHAGAVRNFEAVLTELVARGHELEVAFEITERLAPSHATQLARLDELGIAHGPAPGRRHPRVRRLERSLRASLDYLRYLEPAYAGAEALRERAARQALPFVRGLARRPRLRRSVLRPLLGAWRLVPADPDVVAWLRSRAPDVVLLSPLVDFGSSQHDYVVAAHAAGIPSALLVHSWDNLSNKGLIHRAPDIVTVWNEDLREEAIRLHAIAPERVIVTGASSYDHWFDWAPSSDREAFCRLAGLPVDRPYVLWLCSSPFIAPDEVSIVRAWLAALRAHPTLSDVGVLVRPHPQNARQWEGVELGPAVSIHPRAGSDPVGLGARREYFDSIHHSAAVAGVNTSALIESAIVGRAVNVLVTDASRAQQEGTLHFQLLLKRSEGFLRVGYSLTEHLEMLANAVADGADRDAAFLRSFVRPYGLDQPAAPRVADAIEALARPADL